MTRRKDVARRPADYIDVGEWPDGALSGDAPVEATYAQHVSRTLKAALEDTTISQVARDANLSREAIYDLVKGRAWPELITLARCEQALGLTLWPIPHSLKGASSEPAR